MDLGGVRRRCVEARSTVPGCCCRGGISGKQCRRGVARVAGFARGVIGRWNVRAGAGAGSGGVVGQRHDAGDAIEAASTNAGAMARRAAAADAGVAELAVGKSGACGA